MSSSKLYQAMSFDFVPSETDVKPICIKCNVLLVDSDPSILAIVSKMLLRYGYTVTTTTTAAEALSLARKRRTGYHIVLTDVDFPEMERYEFVEKMNLYSKSPFVIMSTDGSNDAKYNGLVEGAKLYLVKPVKMNDLKFLWQIAYRKFGNEKYPVESIDFEDQERNSYGGSPPQNMVLDEEVASRVLANAASNQQRAKREHRREEEEEEEADGDEDKEEGNGDSTAPKRPKLTWTGELHDMFLLAITMLGNDAAQPRATQKLMNVPGLTRQKVASHLQRHCLALSKEQDAIQENAMNMEGPFAESGNGISPRREQPGFGENTPLFNENMDFSNVVNFDFGSSSESPNLLSNDFVEQSEQERQPQLQLPPPAEEEAGDQGMNVGAETDGVDELFNTENGSTRVVFRDEDLDDFFN